MLAMLRVVVCFEQHFWRRHASSGFALSAVISWVVLILVEAKGSRLISKRL